MESLFEIKKKLEKLEGVKKFKIENKKLKKKFTKGIARLHLYNKIVRNFG